MVGVSLQIVDFVAVYCSIDNLGKSAHFAMQGALALFKNIPSPILIDRLSDLIVLFKNLKSTSQMVHLLSKLSIIRKSTCDIVLDYVCKWVVTDIMNQRCQKRASNICRVKLLFELGLP